MRDDPRKTLKWLEQELLTAEAPARIAPEAGDMDYESTEDLLRRVDDLLAEEPEIPDFVAGRRKTKANRVADRQAVPRFDESAAVPVKTRRQLRQEARQQKKTKKQAGVNRNIKGLVFLAALELLGILAIAGWWLQWLI